jgi:hypothetical protein
MRSPTILLVLLVTSCTTAATKPAQKTVEADPDAPAADTWAALHARGTQLRSPSPAALSQEVRGATELVEIAPGLRAALAHPPAAPSTSDTPVERVPGVVVLASDIASFAQAGFVAIAPESPDVDDAKAAARFLASEPDVDVDHLYAFGDGKSADQLALDPETPFRAVGALGATTTSTFANLPREERIARALLPHASEVATRLIIYAPDDDKAAIAVHARNPKIVIDNSANPFTAFRQLIERDTASSTKVSAIISLPPASSRSAL